MKKYFLVGTLALLCTTTNVFAQEDFMQNDFIQDIANIEGEVENLDIEIIADTNARNVYVAELDENVFGIGFDIVNEWDKTQPGVKHAIELYASDEKGGYLVDKIVYVDVDSLVPGKSIHKELMYSIPQGLPLDQYVLRVVLTTEKGLSLSFVNAGIVEKNEQTGIYIDPSTCYFKIGDEKFALMQGVDVALEEQLELVCESIKNLDAQDTTAFAYTTTKKRTSFGEVVDEKEITKEDFSVGENKQVTYIIEKVSEPQAYEGRFALRFNGQDVSNNIIFRYVVQGESATAQNATTDKDHYESGDTAKVSLMTSGIASAYPGARDQNMDDYLTNASDLVAKVKIVDMNGQACSDEQTKEFDGLGENVQIEVSIKQDCQGPTVITQIQNQKGTILDEADFAVETSTSDTNVTTSAEEKNNTSMMIAIAIATIPLVILAIYFIFRKKKYTNDTGMKTFLFFTILCGSFLFVNINSIDAASFTTGRYHCFTLYGVKGYCVVNGTYDIPNGTDCTNTNAYASMQWSACSNITVDARLYINESRVWRDTNTDTFNNVHWINSNSGQKSKNLGKLSAGNHTVPFKMTFYHDWHNWDFNSGTEVINASKSFSVSRCATNGVCGSRDGKTGEWTTADLGRYAVCESGTFEWNGGLNQPTIGRWEWICKGANGGTDSEICWAQPPTVNGECAETKDPIPKYDKIPTTLCAPNSGTPTAVTGNGSPSNPWKWDCIGSGSNYTSDMGCIAQMNPGRCITSPLSYNYPKSDWPNTDDSTFCEFGAPDPPQNSNTFPEIDVQDPKTETRTWKCSTLGGDSEDCSATNEPPNIACDDPDGVSNINTEPSYPSYGLCEDSNVSTPVYLDEDGTWQWTCAHNILTSLTVDCSADSCIANDPVKATSPIMLSEDMKSNISLNCSGNQNLYCTITNDENEMNITVCSNDSKEIKIEPGVNNLSATCWFDDGDDDNPTCDPSTETCIDIDTFTVMTACMESQCTAGGTCVKTPMLAIDKTACKSSCNSNADCSSGHMIETRP